MFKSGTIEQVHDGVLRALAEVGADPDALRPDATFEELDIDSLDLVELTQILEDEYGVRVESSQLEELTTVGQAIDLVLGLLP
jgi:acyl carrier protein